MIKSNFYTVIKWLLFAAGTYVLSYMWYTYFHNFGLEKFQDPLVGILIGLVIWGSLIAAWVSAEAFIELQKSSAQAKHVKSLKCLPIKSHHARIATNTKS